MVSYLKKQAAAKDIAPTSKVSTSKPSGISSREVTLAGGEKLTGDAAMNYGRSTPIADQTSQLQAPQTEALDPNAQAPQGMIDQVNQLESQVGNVAKTKGLTLQKTPTGGYTTTPDLTAQYKQAHDTLNQSGVEASDTQGAGAAMVKGAIKAPETESPSILGGVMDVDSNFDALFTQYDDFFESKNQTTSLIKEYQKMSKSLGLTDLNEEIVNTKKILDGTEDDIRNEITASGGLATDSQVMALSNARNKSILRNYEALVSTRDNAMTQLSTLMNLSVQDRQFAEAEFDRKLNFGFKVAEFKQKATDNARTGLKWAIENGAGSEILKSPYETSLVEKTLGLPSGGLAGMVSKQNLERQKTEADIANINSQISERGASSAGVKTLSGKPQSTAQASANGYADRLTQSDTIISELGGSFTSVGSFGGLFPSRFQSEDRQRYEQAKSNFITAVLRRESGASISPTEFSTAEKQYFPQAGDKDSVVKQKADNRNLIVNNFYREADVKRPVMPGQIVQSEGKTYKVGSDGETLIEI